MAEPEKVVEEDESLISQASGSVSRTKHVGSIDCTLALTAGQDEDWI